MGHNNPERAAQAAVGVDAATYNVYLCVWGDTNPGTHAIGMVIERRACPSGEMLQDDWGAFIDDPVVTTPQAQVAAVIHALRRCNRPDHTVMIHTRDASLVRAVARGARTERTEMITGVLARRPHTRLVWLPRDDEALTMAHASQLARGALHTRRVRVSLTGDDES